MALLDICLRFPMSSKEARHSRTWWALRLWHPNPSDLPFERWSFLQELSSQVPTMASRAVCLFDYTAGLERYHFRGKPKRFCLAVEIQDWCLLMKALWKKCPSLVPLWLKSQKNKDLDFQDVQKEVNRENFFDAVDWPRNLPEGLSKKRRREDPLDDASKTADVVE